VVYENLGLLSWLFLTAMRMLGLDARAGKPLPSADVPSADVDEEGVSSNLGRRDRPVL
jgi:hypothetical protein